MNASDDRKISDKLTKKVCDNLDADIKKHEALKQLSVRLSIRIKSAFFTHNFLNYSKIRNSTQYAVICENTCIICEYCIKNNLSQAFYVKIESSK